MTIYRPLEALGMVSLLKQLLAYMIKTLMDLLSLEPDPLRFSDFPIMVVGWGFATVKRRSGRKSLWAHSFTTQTLSREKFRGVLSQR